MTTMIVPQDVVDSQLAQCADGEVGDFTVKGGMFKLVPGVGAVISGETITKGGGYTTKAAVKKPDMSSGAAAVVTRKPTAY